MIVAYDIEVLKNLFTATLIDIKTGVASQFVVHDSRNDFIAMCEYLKEVKGMVGFNNVDFDYAVLHPFLKDQSLWVFWTGDSLAKAIYKRAQKVIKEDWRKDYDFPIIPQRDLYRIWHFNNKARATSLKYLEINMDWKNVQEMPIKHTAVIKTQEEIDMVLDYNMNDVLATIEFYHLSKDKIKMRNALGKKYDKDFGNASDTRIGERIFVLEMAKRTGRSEKDIASRRTHRKNIVLRDFIIEGIKFSSAEFGSILDTFKKMIINKTKKTESLSVYFDGMKYEFGFGGLHAFREPGVYKNIVSADVASYYPNLAISYRFYPQHLGEVFCDVYQHLYEERKRYKKGSDESNAIKLALNGVYGMSNAEWSPFYDPAYTMSITINGQLLLAQLCENITLSGSGRVIMANTDGIEVDIYDSDKFNAVCDAWQKDNRLTLEFSTYDRIAARDTNNYIGIKKNGEIKAKGDYVTDREIHKDQSMKIVTEAVRDYFFKDIPVEQTIGECKEIRKFLMGKRAKTGNLEYRRVDGMELVKQTLPKNVRYYISETGGSIVKVLMNGDKERIVNINVGYKQTLFNKWEDKPFEQYGLNKQFYVREARKLIDAIMKNQLQLF